MTYVHCTVYKAVIDKISHVSSNRVNYSLSEKEHESAAENTDFYPPVFC